MRLVRRGHVQFRTTSAERELLERASQIAGESLSRFLRGAALARATVTTIEVRRPAEAVASEAER